MIRDFKDTVAREHNIDVNILGLKDHYDSGEEIVFDPDITEQPPDTSTPEKILAYLKEGNSRFVSGNIVSRRFRNMELNDFLKDSPLATYALNWHLAHKHFKHSSDVDFFYPNTFGL